MDEKIANGNSRFAKSPIHVCNHLAFKTGLAYNFCG